MATQPKGSGGNVLHSSSFPPGTQTLRGGGSLASPGPVGAGAAFKDGGSPGAPSRNASARPGTEKSRAGRRRRPRFPAAALPI